jgi:hypothetical protein
MNVWSGLIEQTRGALATLDVQDLEELAARAELMLDEAASLGAWGHGSGETERAGIVREHRLLGDLLAATGRNLEVLRRLGRDRRMLPACREVNRRWVR